MGTVYFAIRDDEEFEQRAAIKLIKYGLDTTELLDRFRRERQILANLDHPYIARLIDGGSTQEGRPYLAMEYVEGQSVGAWQRERNPSVEECCRLFLKVCEAVAHAHRNLVVHRDLKPGNILIGADGSPKLLDFGVAKLLAVETGPELTATALAGGPLTPDYASPEQVQGRPVTTATDVYSLGAILSSFTGSKAQRIVSSSPADVEKAVCVTPIMRPSEAVSAARLRRDLSGDLDNIVQMAMRKEPARRYSSVEQLAADVRRYLEGQPVAARKDSLRYRGGKFVRRHRLGLSAATLSILSLVGGTIMAVSQGSAPSSASRQWWPWPTIPCSTYTPRSSGPRCHPGPAADRQHHASVSGGAVEGRGSDEGLRMAVGVGYLKLAQGQGEPYGPSLRDFPAALKSYRTAADFIGPLRRAHPEDPRA